MSHLRSCLGQALATLVDSAEGEVAQAVGAALRDFGAMEPLIELLDRPETQQDALRVIGNLSSNAVDARMFAPPTPSTLCVRRPRGHAATLLRAHPRPPHSHALGTPEPPSA